MKRCPTCQRNFSEDHLTFCTDDGTPLVSVTQEDSPDEVTRVSASQSSGAGADRHTNDGPAYQPPGSYLPPGPTVPKRRAWPWLLALVSMVLLAAVGIGIIAVLFIPRTLRAINRKSVVNVNDNRTNLNRNFNVNLNSNQGSTNDNGNANTDDSTPPPTDENAVLADLKELEDQWTVANINADKRALNRILADDYVGITNGRAQGKAEYLKTIERDTAIQHWEFDNLKVTLKGDRASLSGILRLDVKDENGQAQQQSFKFIDKFVWRDGRWQATGSEVEPIKAGTAV